MSDLPARLEWDCDGTWLVLCAGPWRLSVADIETHDQGATLYLHDWTRTDPTEHTIHGRDGESTQEVLCRSVAEARLVCARMLDVRGVTVPDPCEEER